MSAEHASSPLSFTAQAFAEMIGHAYGGYPLEACGLLVGQGSRVLRFVACTNAAESARIYSIPPKELLRAERDADDDGLAIVGVFHSHTHSEPYPSPTDVAQAPDPDWHYVIVSLKREAPETRAYRIVGPEMTDIRDVPVGVG